MTAALLVMDVQNAIVARIPDQAPSLLATLRRATAAARAAGVGVVFVQVAFRPGYPEVSRRNRWFSTLTGERRLSLDDPSTEIHPDLGRQPDDIVVVKKRVSAFAGSDLDMVLRGLDADSLVLSGVSTSGVVLSTLRQAADLDYGLTVLRDGCADGDAEVHRVLLDKVFPRQADVVTTAEWASSLSP